MKKINKDFVWGGTQPFFQLPFISSFVPDLKNRKLLDCGCGKGINGYLIRTTRDLIGGKLIGLDANEYYLNYCKHFNVYDQLVQCTLPNLPFKDKSIDVLVCTEVIEHMGRKDGEKFLKEADRVASERIIITTPNVFFDTHQAVDKDKHRSLWAIESFKKLGYKVYGMGFKTTILYNDPLIRLKQALYYFFTPLSYLFPEISGTLLCVKDFK